MRMNGVKPGMNAACTPAIPSSPEFLRVGGN
jgi:hypothetical protein